MANVTVATKIVEKVVKEEVKTGFNLSLSIEEAEEVMFILGQSVPGTGSCLGMLYNLMHDAGVATRRNWKLTNTDGVKIPHYTIAKG